MTVILSWLAIFLIVHSMLATTGDCSLMAAKVMSSISNIGITLPGQHTAPWPALEEPKLGQGQLLFSQNVHRG